MLESFTGQSIEGMDMAVKDAHTELGIWLRKHYGASVVSASATCYVRGDGMGNEYWFVLTVLFKAIDD